VQKRRPKPEGEEKVYPDGKKPPDGDIIRVNAEDLLEMDLDDLRRFAVEDMGLIHLTEDDARTKIITQLLNAAHDIRDI